MNAETLITPTVESETCCICGRSVKDQWFAHFPGPEGRVSLCSLTCAMKYLDQPTPPPGHRAQDALAQSDRTISANLIALYKSLGGGWEIQSSSASVPSAGADETNAEKQVPMNSDIRLTTKAY